MWKLHPQVEEIRAFLAKSTSETGDAPRNAQIVRHLLAECPICLGRLLAAGWTQRRFERLFHLTERDLPAREEAAEGQRADYGVAFAKTEQKLADFLAAELPLAEPVEILLEEIHRVSEEDQEQLVRQVRFAHPEVVRHLMDRSHAARYENPHEMLRLALLARLAAEACSVEAAGSTSRLADLRTRAWGCYGNSLRVCGDLQAADEAIATAWDFFDEGTGDPPLHARLLEQTASLRSFQGCFQEAARLAELAGTIYRSLEDRHDLGSTMVQRAIAFLYAGETETAIDLLNRAIPRIDPGRNPHILLAACHNLIRGYIDLDRPAEALSLYCEARALYQQLGEDTTIRLRTGWQEGQLLRDLGNLSAAEQILLQARQGFLERGLAYEVALVSLDLASIYVRRNQSEELKAIVSEALPIFRALRVERESLAALLQLQQAAGQEKQALELIRLLNAQLAALPRKSI